MGLALYRKYRPKTLADVVGQDVIIETLQNALKSGAISHAYLFTGPRGVGKTSIARILAHEINKLPYSDETSHLDIIEIDAASNRRIDEIRELRDKIHISPTSAKYKVYIIDEVHMLTREAFNALLKTLEEPPEHAVFILATTEAHKVPETILSRTQRFSFRPITPKDAVMHLRSIANKESITIDDESLELIAAHSNGGFRDAISMLDQLASTANAITPDVVRQSIGMPNTHLIDRIVQALTDSDAKTLIEALLDARTQGVHASTLAQHIATNIRDTVMSSASVSTQQVQLLQQLSAVPASASQFTALELAVLSFIAHVSQPLIKKTVAVPQEVSVRTTAVTATKHNEPEPPKVEKTIKQADIPEEKEGSHTDVVVLSGEPFEQWDDILTDIKKKHNTIYGILRIAEPRFEDDTLTLGFKFAFHQKQMAQAKNVEHISDSIERVTGKKLVIVCVISSNTVTEARVPKIETVKKVEKNGHITDISNIFAGAELLE